MKRVLALLLLQFVLAAPVMWSQEHAGEHAGAHADGAHGEAAHHEDHGPGGPNATLWKTVNFVLLIGIAAYFLRGKIGPFFAGRNQAIAQGMSVAAAKEREAQERMSAVEAKLAGLEGEIARLKENSKLEMERDRERIEAETAAAIQRLREHAAAEIASASALARNDLRRHAAALALELAEQRIVNETKSPETRQRLLAQAIRKLGEPGTSSRN